MFSEDVHRPVADPLAKVDVIFHHSISCICIISTARYDTFWLALPLIQSTIVLLSHRITNSIPSTVLGGSITKESSSLSFLRSIPPSIFLICNGDKWMANTRVGITSAFLGGLALHFCIKSSSDPAHLAKGVSHYGNPTCASSM